MSPEERKAYDEYLKKEAAKEQAELEQLAEVPTPPLFERARLAAPFLARWTDPGESMTDSRMLPRVRSALKLADLLWRTAQQEEQAKKGAS